MLPLGHFRNVMFSGAQGLTFALYFALSAVTFFLPMTMIGGWGASAAEVSIAFLPFGIALTLLSSTAGKLSDKIGPGPMIAIGAIIVAIGFVLLGLLAPLRSVWFGVLPPIIVMGLGMSAVVSPLSTAVMTSVEDRDTGLASGVNNAVARVAGLLAVALMGRSRPSCSNGHWAGSLSCRSISACSPNWPSTPRPRRRGSRPPTRPLRTIAYINAGLALLSAAIAWFTQANKLRK